MILKIPDVFFVTRTSHAVAECLLGPKRTSEDTHPMSLSGAKRTWPSHREMSAYDPKRTFAARLAPYPVPVVPDFNLSKALGRQSKR
jgi:hypothetical protein